MFCTNKLLQKSCRLQGASLRFSVHGLAVDLGLSGVQGWQVLCSSPSVSKLPMGRDFSNLHSFDGINIWDRVAPTAFPLWQFLLEFRAVHSSWWIRAQCWIHFLPSQAEFGSSPSFMYNNYFRCFWRLYRICYEQDIFFHEFLTFHLKSIFYLGLAICLQSCLARHTLLGNSLWLLNPIASSQLCQNLSQRLGKIYTWRSGINNSSPCTH